MCFSSKEKHFFTDNLPDKKTFFSKTDLEKAGGICRLPLIFYPNNAFIVFIFSTVSCHSEVTSD